MVCYFLLTIVEKKTYREKCKYTFLPCFIRTLKLVDSLLKTLYFMLSKLCHVLEPFFFVISTSRVLSMYSFSHFKILDIIRKHRISFTISLRHKKWLCQSKRCTIHNRIEKEFCNHLFSEIKIGWTFLKIQRPVLFFLFFYFCAPFVARLGQISDEIVMYKINETI